MAAYVCGRLTDKQDWNAAESECKRAMALDPTSPDAALSTAALYRRLKRYPEALEAVSHASGSIDRMRVSKASINAAMGRPDEARRVIAESVEAAKGRYVRADAVARVFVQLGDRETAVRWLQRAVDARSASLLGFDFDAPLIKDDPRVKAIAQQVKASIKPMN